MIPFLLYITKLSCCLTFFYLGYKFLLSNETFFHFNRKILLTGMFVCLLLPLIKIKTEKPGIIQQPMIQLEKIMMEEEEHAMTFTVNGETGHTSIPAGKQFPPISPDHLLALIFVTGGFIHACLLIRSHVSLYLLIRSGRKIKCEDYTLVLFDKAVTPFNYGHYIILSEKDYNEYPDTILTHELAHFRFSHSFDIALVELLSLLQWFNPVIRLLKKEIRKVHEFQADSEVLKTGIDATKYQFLLVRKAVGSSSYAFANSFNHSKLKIRFTMMSKKKSNSWARLKLLLLLPVAALSMYAFASPDVTRQSEPIIRSEDTAISSNNQNETASISGTSNDGIRTISISVIDNTGKELRTFQFEDKDTDVSGSFALDNADPINDMKEWFNNRKKEDFRHLTVTIKAHPETNMGVVIDLKALLRSFFSLKVSYASY